MAKKKDTIPHTSFENGLSGSRLTIHGVESVDVEQKTGWMVDPEDREIKIETEYGTMTIILFAKDGEHIDITFPVKKSI